MKYPLIIKEIKDLFKSKTALIYFILLFAIISYSFYSAIDLYSKASVSAINNPLYATGFEPIPGVFGPTFGGFFLILSLIAPFLFIQSISTEKNNNTLVLLAQFPFSLSFVFISKLLSAIILVIISIITFIPLLIFWKFLGGHIPFIELSLLILGYFLYSLFVISVSFFSSAMFKSSSQASIFTIAIIMLSWFIDFGKEMSIVPFFNNLAEWTVTAQLKQFEDGILSIQSIIYFILLSCFFSLLAYLFFNFSIKNKIKPLLIIVFSLIFILFFVLNFQFKKDISESRKNSFSKAKTDFLNLLPDIEIKVFLEPTDSRFKDYENDFLKKLKMIKNNQTISFATGKLLKENYGRFEYGIKTKKTETYSNSEHEIFMILEEISGKKIEASIDKSQFSGYPLVVNKKWSIYLFILYLIIFPLLVILIYKKRRKKT